MAPFKTSSPHQQSMNDTLKKKLDKDLQVAWSFVTRDQFINFTEMTQILSMMSYLSHYDQGMSMREKLLSFELWTACEQKAFKLIKVMSPQDSIDQYDLSD